MAWILGFARDQLLLLPEAVDDTWSPTIRSIFIDALVDGLDLAAAGSARAEAKATGRPGYAPGDLLKLYVCGYLNRVRSSRRLERECRRSPEWRDVFVAFHAMSATLEHHVREILRHARCNQQHSGIRSSSVAPLATLRSQDCSTPLLAFVASCSANDDRVKTTIADRNSIYRRRRE
jgi:transposase